MDYQNDIVLRFAEVDPSIFQQRAAAALSAARKAGVPVIDVVIHF